MYLTTGDLRLATKGLGDDGGVEDIVLESFITDSNALINQSLNRRYIIPLVRTPANGMAWDLLATAQKYYCLMRLELYLRLQQGVGEDELQIVDPVEYKKLFDEIIKDINMGKTVLMGLEKRQDQEVNFKMRKSPFEGGFPRW